VFSWFGPLISFVRCSLRPSIEFLFLQHTPCVPGPVSVQTESRSTCDCQTLIYTLDGGIHRSTPFAYRESTEFYESLFIKDPIDSGVSVSSNQPGLVQSSTQQHGIAMNSWAASVRAFRSALRASRQCSRRIGNAGPARIRGLCRADGVQAAGVLVAARDGQRAPPLLPHREEAAARAVQQRVANWPRRTIVTSRTCKSIPNCDAIDDCQDA
jgi:hypothetical protein